MAKKKELETMEVRFDIEYEPIPETVLFFDEENQMRVVRGMADPVDLCEVDQVLQTVSVTTLGACTSPPRACWTWPTACLFSCAPTAPQTWHRPSWGYNLAAH